MRAKWRIVISCTAVFATDELGLTYHPFSHYDNDRKALETAGQGRTRWAWSHCDWLGHSCWSVAPPSRRDRWGEGCWFHTGDRRLRCGRRYKISVQWWFRILKDRHSRRYDNKLIPRRATRLADDRNVGRSRGRLCQLLCSQFVISRTYRVWLSVWQCCRQ